MSTSEEARTDPSSGKSAASPSAPGKGTPSRTVFEDPATQVSADALPQSSPVPDVVRDLREGRKPR